jgi:hypothetical protein
MRNRILCLWLIFVMLVTQFPAALWADDASVTEAHTRARSLPDGDRQLAAAIIDHYKATGQTDKITQLVQELQTYAAGRPMFVNGNGMDILAFAAGMAVVVMAGFASPWCVEHLSWPMLRFWLYCGGFFGSVLGSVGLFRRTGRPLEEEGLSPYLSMHLALRHRAQAIDLERARLPAGTRQAGVGAGAVHDAAIEQVRSEARLQGAQPGDRAGLTYDGEGEFFRAVDQRVGERSMLAKPWAFIVWALGTALWLATAKMHASPFSPYMGAVAMALSLTSMLYTGFIMPWMEERIDRSFARKLDELAQREGDSLSLRWWTKFLTASRIKAPMQWDSTTPAATGSRRRLDWNGDGDDPFSTLRNSQP